MSAGSQPKKVNPIAVRVMQEVGIDLSKHRSKAIDELPIGQVDLVITLCAEEVCPVLPGKTRKIHWPYPDPAVTKGDEKSVLEAFRRTRDLIRTRLQEFGDEYGLKNGK